MAYYLLCALVFLGAYLVNIFYISVLYHRGLTHGAVKLHPWMRRFVAHTGNWITGLDPKGWACMHRMHHEYSDTPNDPHSPVHQGVFGLALGQLHSYNFTLVRLLRGDPRFQSVVADLDFSVSWLNRHRVWWLPYLFHLAVAFVTAVAFGAWLLGAAYWLGMMSHPVQGWMVNALAHRFGYRNFDTSDNSRNNLMVAWLVFGEGYQNNHHRNPSAPKFSVRWWEVDPGWVLCRLARVFGLLEIPPLSSRGGGRSA